MAKGQDRPALDDLDRRLMEVLQVDGRRPFTEIATAFAVPESTIRARYKALVDRGALKVIAVADPLKVGYPLMAMIGVRCTPAALLSTATALHALACMERPLSEDQRERCLDFVDTLWTAEGGFHGHWADDALDPEYTFYGLLALGHLAV